MSQESDRINAKHSTLLKAREEPERILTEMRAELRSHLESAQLLTGILHREYSNTDAGHRFEEMSNLLYETITVAQYSSRPEGKRS